MRGAAETHARPRLAGRRIPARPWAGRWPAPAPLGGPLPARLALSLAVLLAAATPAAAHKMKVFATVEGATISGYAFFVGGGRPQGAHVVFRDASGHDLGSAVTDTAGAFAFTPPRPEDIAIVVDAGDGHSAETRIGAERLAPAGLPPAATGQAPARQAPASQAPASQATASQTATDPAAGAPALPALPACDPDQIARLVDVAVARQIRPLLEAQEAAQDKLRFNDIAGGIGMIVGLAGAALWASARRRAPPAPPPA